MITIQYIHRDERTTWPKDLKIDNRIRMRTSNHGGVCLTEFKLLNNTRCGEELKSKMYNILK